MILLRYTVYIQTTLFSKKQQKKLAILPRVFSHTACLLARGDNARCVRNLQRVFARRRGAYII